VQSIAILVIEDNEVQRKVIEFNLSREGYRVLSAGTVSDAMTIFKRYMPDIVIADVMLPDGNGIELMEKMLGINTKLVVIIVTAYGTIRMAVDAMKRGAYDYITKPYEQEELLLSVRQAVRCKIRNGLYNPYTLIGQSNAIREVLNLIERVANSDVPVLITGETGTGKEVVARAIHSASNRKGGPFVAVNCAAIPEQLLETELFGYTKGAFTGATQDKPGKFMLADPGTLFLDEIGSMDITLQSKLLRVIETGYIDVIGDVKSKKVDIRIISATNADPLSLIKKGLFREDLYYRLNVIHISIPPLRERKEDIPLLVDHFISLYGYKGRIKIDDKAMQLLLDYPWYGNVRELENFIRRLIVIKGDGVIQKDDILNNISSTISSSGAISGESLDEVEKKMILSALEKSGHNMSRAAKILNIPRHKLIYRMKKYKIK